MANFILLKNADFIITANKQKDILSNTSILIEDNIIKKINPQENELKKYLKNDLTIIDVQGKVIIPGFVNCHHHLFQAGLRGVPELQNQAIEKWINLVCKMSRSLDEETMYYYALVNLGELLLYGTTTSSDFHYLFSKKHKGTLEAAIKAAQKLGIRFQPYRSSMSLSQKDGALFPDDTVQDQDTILRETEELIKKYHDASFASMVRVGLGPCTVFTSTTEDYKKAGELASKYHVNLQTHLSESKYEESFIQEKYQKTVLQYLQDLGWKGKSVSFVHGIYLSDEDIKTLAETNSNLVHCPLSNARGSLGETGLAPISKILDYKVNVGVGVDGSAGNDSSNLLEELRWARTLPGTLPEATYLKANTVMEMGTINGAKVLNWDSEIGSLEEGKIADLAIFNLENKLEQAGSFYDPALNLFGCQARRADTVIVNGKIVVQAGKLQFLAEKEILHKINGKIRNKVFTAYKKTS